LLQIVSPEGEVARFPGGGLLERNLIDDIVMLTSRRLSWWNTKRSVEQAVRDATAEAILALKRETVGIVMR
jgi:hypothetical protein